MFLCAHPHIVLYLYACALRRVLGSESQDLTLRSNKAVVDNRSVHTKRQRWSLKGGWEVAHTVRTLILVTGWFNDWFLLNIFISTLQCSAPVDLTAFWCLDPWTLQTPHTQCPNRMTTKPRLLFLHPLLCAVLPGCLNSFLVFLLYILALKANLCCALLALIYLKKCILAVCACAMLLCVCHDACVEDRGKHCEVCSLLSHLRSFWEANSGC